MSQNAWILVVQLSVFQPPSVLPLAKRMFRSRQKLHQPCCIIVSAIVRVSQELNQSLQHWLVPCLQRLNYPFPGVAVCLGVEPLEW